ncbi:MAG: inositol 2-dehydrogenase, partial [Deltaproteobacteria bacterium]|nr:inositol 2-dehydrogenase [Deltaproteobacteria bacterium]
PEVRGIADVDVGAARRLAGEIGVSRVSDDCRELLAAPDIDAVLVCSSTDTHADVVIDAATAGKQIFCEKPLDLDLGRIDAALAAVRRAGVRLMLGFNRRFDPDFRRVRDAVAAGAVGRPELLRITSRDPSPPPAEYVKRSGGMFLDMTIHDFDMARFVMDDEVEEVFVAAANLVDPAIGAAGDVDTAAIVLRFASGAIGTIDNSRRAVYGYDQRIEVFGSAGMVANANRTPHTAVHADASGFHAALPLNFFMERYSEAYAIELAAFVAALRAGTEPPVGGEDGRRAIVIGKAAGMSVKSGRPVRLSEVEATTAATAATGALA